VIIEFMAKDRIAWLPGEGVDAALFGAIEAHQKMATADRDRSSPSTLVQMFLLWRYQVATMDRRSFGSIGAEGQHYLRLSIATGLEELKIGLERIRAAAADVRGFQQFIQEGKHLC
jgi:hypothetical protein